MEDKIKEAMAVKKMRITLRVTASDPESDFECAMCGGQYLTNGSGLDYHVENAEQLICEKCVKEYAPEMVETLREALSFGCLEASRASESIRERIKAAIKVPIEERIMKALDELCRDANDRFQKSNIG